MAANLSMPSAMPIVAIIASETCAVYPVNMQEGGWGMQRCEIHVRYKVFITTCFTGRGEFVEYYIHICKKLLEATLAESKQERVIYPAYINDYQRLLLANLQGI